MFSSLFSTLERSVSFIDTYFDDILSSASSRSISLESDHPLPTSPSLLAWLSAAPPPPEIEPVLCVPHVLTAVLAWMERGLSYQCAERLTYDRSCVVDVLEFFKSRSQLPESLDGRSAMGRDGEALRRSGSAVCAGESRRGTAARRALRHAASRHAALRDRLPDPHAPGHSTRHRALLQDHSRARRHHALPAPLHLFSPFGISSSSQIRPTIAPPRARLSYASSRPFSSARWPEDAPHRASEPPARRWCRCC